MRAGRELRFAQVDRHTSEPGEHRASPECLRAAPEFRAVEDRDERDLVAFGVAAGGKHPLHDCRRAGESRVEADGDEAERTEQTHRQRA